MAVSAAVAQEKKDVPPPPKAANDGPSLEVTMKFIQDKVSEIGPLNSAVYCHSTAGNDFMNRRKVEATNVVANASTCRFSYRWKWEQDGTVVWDVDVGFSFKDVGDIVVMPVDQYQKEVDTAAGHPEISCRADPPLFALKVRRTDIKRSNAFDFDFPDEQTANRVAKAMVHAVELCGGGSKPEPF
jgi:hypothetical protein